MADKTTENKAPLVSTAKAGVKYIVNRMPLSIVEDLDGQKVVVNGVGKGPRGIVIPGAPYGVTIVDGAVWDKFYAKHKNSTLIKNREIYAVDTPLEIDTFAQSTAASRATGYEGIDPNNPSKGLGGPKVEKADKDTK